MSVSRVKMSQSAAVRCIEGLFRSSLVSDRGLVAFTKGCTVAIVVQASDPSSSLAEVTFRQILTSIVCVAKG